MTVRDAIQELRIREAMVIYRLYDGDIFSGMCKYDGESLISYDGDSYDLSDRIVNYKMDPGVIPYLTIWQ